MVLEEIQFLFNHPLTEIKHSSGRHGLLESTIVIICSKKPQHTINKLYIMYKRF